MSLYLEYGSDFVLNQNGGLQNATGWTSVRQTIERAFLTSPSTALPGQGPLPPDYIFHPTYGTGAQREVGEHVTDEQLSVIASKLQQAAAANPAVDPLTPVEVSISRNGFQTIVLTAQVTLRNKTQGQVVFLLPQ